MQVDVYKTAGSVSTEVGGFFEARCKMIADYHAELTGAGLFDQTVADLFLRAERCGALEKVKRMLLLMLQRG